jgi:hypothetical protein
LTAFAFLHDKPYYATGMIIVTSTMLFTMLPLLLRVGMPTLRSMATWQRKHFLTTWIGHLIALAVLLIAVIIAVPADKPEQRLMIYSLWAASAGLSFLSHAVEAGIYYVIAGIMFCMSFVFALTPTWAPLEIAVFMTVNLIVQGIYLRGRSTEPASSSTSSSQIAAATTAVTPARKA